MTPPESIMYIGDAAFSGCKALKSVSIRTDDVASVDASLPEGEAYVGVNAFKGCSALTRVTLPDSVTTIESSILIGCDDLTCAVSPASCARTWCRENGVPYAYADCFFASVPPSGRGMPPARRK